MEAKVAQTYLTPQEYIALERKTLPDADTVRSEYLNGEIIAMSGASFAHNLITASMSGELRARLKGSGCVVFANDMRVSIPLTTSYFYPDVDAVCEKPRFEDDVFDTLLTHPKVIVEVLSPSTEAYDRGEKFVHYRQLQSLKEYILVSQDKVHVEHYFRPAEQWVFTDFQKLEQQLPLISIQCKLPLQEIYALVPFPD